MDLFRKLGRQVEEFKTKAENAAENTSEQCAACGAEFDTHHDQCPDCGSEQVGRVDSVEASGDGTDDESAKNTTET